MIVGIDFDNTIVDYSSVFSELSIVGLPPEVARTKLGIRGWLRAKDRQDDWTKLQGEVYGVGIHQAQPFPGVKTFIESCGAASYVVSHKTRHPVIGPPHDLPQEARRWLRTHHIIDPKRAFFEPTAEDKCARIAALGITHFVDDLPEFLLHPAFPASVKRILFDPGTHHSGCGLQSFPTWDALTAWFRAL